ncbi:hypothetical protein MY3296_004058 [Beauveria thailandica]
MPTPFLSRSLDMYQEVLISTARDKERLERGQDSQSLHQRPDISGHNTFTLATASGIHDRKPFNVREIIAEHFRLSTGTNYGRFELPISGHIRL